MLVLRETTYQLGRIAIPTGPSGIPTSTRIAFTTYFLTNAMRAAGAHRGGFEGFGWLEGFGGHRFVDAPEVEEIFRGRAGFGGLAGGTI